MRLAGLRDWVVDAARAKAAITAALMGAALADYCAMCGDVRVPAYGWHHGLFCANCCAVSAKVVHAVWLRHHERWHDMGNSLLVAMVVHGLLEDP